MKKKHRKSVKDKNSYYINPEEFNKIVLLYKKNPVSYKDKLLEYFKKLVLGVINGTTIKESWYNHTFIEFEDLINEGVAHLFSIVKYYKPKKEGKKMNPFSYFSVIVKHHLVNYINKEREHIYEHNNKILKEYSENSFNENEISEYVIDKVINILINKKNEIEQEIKLIPTYYKYVRYKKFLMLVNDILKSKNRDKIFNRLCNLTSKERKILTSFIKKEDIFDGLY